MSQTVARSRQPELGESSYVLPNTRVQRTRSSPSARHSPLTRRPLGAAVNCSGPRAVSYSNCYHSVRPAAAIVAIPRRAGTSAQETGSDWGLGRWVA